VVWVSDFFHHLSKNNKREDASVWWNMIMKLTLCDEQRIYTQEEWCEKILPSLE
jgi:hypothetical protein